MGVSTKNGWVVSDSPAFIDAFKLNFNQDLPTTKCRTCVVQNGVLPLFWHLLYIHMIVYNYIYNKYNINGLSNEFLCVLPTFYCKFYCLKCTSGITIWDMGFWWQNWTLLAKGEICFKLFKTKLSFNRKLFTCTCIQSTVLYIAHINTYMYISNLEASHYTCNTMYDSLWGL